MNSRKVLVPLDGSVPSRSALTTVEDLFDPATTLVTLLHVAPVPEAVPVKVPEPVVLGTELRWPREGRGPTVYSSQEWESARANVLPLMDEDAERLRSVGFTVTRVVRFGDPATEIADQVEHEGYDAVVMATHGRSGLSRAVMGSVAEQVLRQVLAPVVMVREVGREVRAQTVR